MAKPYAAEGRPAKTGRQPFEVGDVVEVRNECVPGHIRMPGYVRGKRGVVLHRTTEKWPFPDAIGHGQRNAAHEPTYHVRFKVTDIWGSAAGDGFVVVDLFESYLDKVEAGSDTKSATKKVGQEKLEAVS